VQPHRTRQSPSIPFLLVGALCAAQLGACAQPAGPEGPVAAVHDETAPPRAISPLVGLTGSAADAPTAGTVLERLPAGPYTYLRVQAEPPAPDAWLATLGDGAPVGTEITIRSLGSRAGFQSKRLGRTFERLDFALVSPRTSNQEINR